MIIFDSLYRRRNWRALSLVLLAILIFPTQLQANHRGPSPLMQQLTQFNGGCPPHEQEAPGGCIDVQFSVHRAPNCVNGPDESVGGYSTSMVREFGNPPPLAGGSSTLVRADDGLSFNLTTNGLRPYAPYTVWWVAFNPDNPCIVDAGDCTCSAESLRENLDGVFWATGAMTDILGATTFSGHVNYGQTPTGFDQIPFGGAFNAGIQPGAEIHFVVRAHGPRLRARGPHRFFRK